MTAVDHAELKRVEAELVQMLAPDQGESAHPAFGHAVRIQNAHAALLSEIEGLKAERDAYRDAAHLEAVDCDAAQAALRTQAPDSWRPIAEHDNSADEVLVMAEGWTKPIVAWRHHPSSRTDQWLSVPGNYRVHPTEFHALPVLRPQTAESGK